MSRIREFWVVTEPTPISSAKDIVFMRVTPASLMQQIKGGLVLDRTTAIFTDADEALAEGSRRIVARREYDAMLRKGEPS